MGCNYYVEKNKCDCCGRSDKLHIGKSSYGREFTFKGHSYLEEDREKHLGTTAISSYADILETIKKCKIVDEYGEYIPISDFKKLVKEKKKSQRHEGYERSTRDNKDNYFSFCTFF